MVIETSRQLGIPTNLAFTLGVLTLIGTLLYAYPRTSVLGAILQFLIVAVVVYFAFVLPINHLKKMAFSLKKTPAESLQEEKEELPPTETELLIEIRDLLAQGRPSADQPTGATSAASSVTVTDAPPHGRHGGSATS